MPSKTAEQLESLEQRLNHHPKLKTKIEALLSVALGGNRIELFARSPRYGWKSWGAEAG